MKKKLISFLVLGVVLSLGVFSAVAVAGNGKGHGGGSTHVTICHATGTPDNAGNGYVQISPSASGVYHGHYRQHQADIIPPFQYQGNTYSLNWDSAHIAIWKNGCKPVASITTTGTTNSTTTSATTTSSVTTTQKTTTTAPTKTVTVTKTTTVKTQPKPAPTKVVKKVYLPKPAKQATVKPNGFPYTP